MLFSSINYLLFLPVIFCLYWLTSGRTRKVILLVASYFFYMSWMPSYGLMLFLLTAVNFGMGILIERHRDKKVFLVAALLVNIGALVYYKYANFLLSSIFEAQRTFVSALDIHAKPLPTPVLDIVLPLGISFFAFEFIHYCVDIKRGSKALRNPLDFALFASFFPSQVAGPIKRYQQFDEQLKAPKLLNQEDMIVGLGFLMKGLFKKVALADNLAPITAMGVNNVQGLGTLDAWILMFVFVLQVYFDFSGYTDMGIGSARLLGFHLPNNFNLPYIASKNLMEFWQRWHITLSSWLRDYLQTPMTGFRASRLRFNVATIVTMTICGLWHGAAWHYVLWGLVHGLLLVATREYLQVVKGSQALKKLHAKSWSVPVACISTFILLHFTQPFFIAHSVPDAFVILRDMVWFTPATSSEVATAFSHSPVLMALLLYCIYGLIFVEIPWFSATQKLARLQILFTGTVSRQVAVYVCIFIAAIAFCPEQTSPFIYFQF